LRALWHIDGGCLCSLGCRQLFERWCPKPSHYPVTEFRPFGVLPRGCIGVRQYLVHIRVIPAAQTYPGHIQQCKMRCRLRQE
jgi:hypothetical protein